MEGKRSEGINEETGHTHTKKKGKVQILLVVVEIKFKPTITGRKEETERGQRVRLTEDERDLSLPVTHKTPIIKKEDCGPTSRNESEKYGLQFSSTSIVNSKGINISIGINNVKYKN